MWVVLDTNIVISALLQALGPSAAIFLLALSHKLQLCLTEPVFDEYEEVIRRSRFKLDPEVIKKSLLSIRGAGHWAKPTGFVHECKDPDDNMFLECAEAAGADYLITGNMRDFPKTWKKTKIVTAREFLTAVAEDIRKSL